MNTRITIVGFLVFLAASIFGQSKLEGIVFDLKTGTPVSGAMIFVKDSKARTTTSTDGKFQLLVEKGNVIMVSELYHLSNQFKFNGESFREIGLSLDTTKLTEVIVTGVGKATSRKKLGIDVASINMKEASQSAFASVEQALQGRLSGVNIQFTSGLPGTASQIFLRGLNDLTGSGPLIMIDGVQIHGGLNGLDLNSIDRAEVVKGAAGGTLYGAQGANGVIQIFTKKGNKNKNPIISFQSKISVDKILKGKDLIAKMHSYETDGDGYIVNSTGNRIQPDINNAWPDPVFMEGDGVMNNKVYREKTFDHIDQTYSTAISSNIGLNISGSNNNTDYNFAVGYLNQQNVLFNGFKRYNIVSNIGFNPSNSLKIRSSSQLIFTDENLLAGGDRFNITNSWKYIDFLARDSKGYIVVKPKLNENTLNPLSEKNWRSRDSRQFRVIQNVNINYQPNVHTEFDYKYGLEYSNTDFNDFYKNQTFAPQSSSAYWGANLKGSITKSFSSAIFQHSLFSANLKFDFLRDFHLSIPVQSNTLFCYDWRNLSNRSYFAQGSIFQDFPPYNINTAIQKTSGDYSDQFITYGLLVNQNFDYYNIAGIGLGYRKDLSSEFGDAKNAQQFYHANFFIRPTEFFQNNLLKDWKIRAAFGQAGIQPYTFMPYARQLVYDVSAVGVGGVGISSPSQSRNPLLKISTSNEFEIGTDLMLKNPGKNKGNTSLSISFWQRKVFDAYQYGDNSPSTGFSQAINNLTDLSGSGIDLSLDAELLSRKNFTWTTGIRYGKFHVVADKIANGVDIVSGNFALKQGQRLGTFYSQTALIDINQLKPDGSRYIPLTDIGNYELVNGIVVNKTTKKIMLTLPNDRSVTGSAYPKFNASFINHFKLNNNINIDLQFDWKYGNKIYNLTRQWLYRDRLSADYDEAITIDGKTGAYVNYYNSMYNSVSPVDCFVESGSMIRLRDFSISCKINEKFYRKVIKSANVVMSGRNLLTITKYKGLDPEATGIRDSQNHESFGVGAINGVDYFGVPNLRSFMITLNMVL